MRRVGVGIYLLAALSVLFALPVRADEMTLVVSADGPYGTIVEALADAQDGDRIEVRGGVYGAPLTIDKSVEMIGIDSPVIDGGGVGSLVVITAPDTVFQGFVLRNSGSNMSHEDCGIVVQAPRVTVADNVLENVLFGVYFAEADDGVARNNFVRGLDLDMGMRGDSFRVWYSNGVTLEGNTAVQTRDVLIWYADDLMIRDNQFYDNRYGLHFMYNHVAIIENNRFENNHIGFYAMYSENLTITGNRFANNRGPSGYALAFKDVDGLTASDNVIISNRAGLYIDNSPSRMDVTNTYRSNLFAYNDIGVTALPSTRNNVFVGNTFLDNTQQASTEGRGTLQANLWQQDGVGNYWSDYIGYDENGDGVGDMPYRAEKLFDSLADNYPALRLFSYSPAVQALDFAAAAFPTFRPEPKLIDDAPLVRYQLPVVSESMAAPRSTAPSAAFVIGALALVIFGGAVSVYALRFVFPPMTERLAS